MPSTPLLLLNGAFSSTTVDSRSAEGSRAGRVAVVFVTYCEVVSEHLLHFNRGKHSCACDVNWDLHTGQEISCSPLRTSIWVAHHRRHSRESWPGRAQRQHVYLWACCSDDATGKNCVISFPHLRFSACVSCVCTASPSKHRFMHLHALPAIPISTSFRAHFVSRWPAPPQKSHNCSDLALSSSLAPHTSSCSWSILNVDPKTGHCSRAHPFVH